jgi:hypothetical protein
MRGRAQKLFGITIACTMLTTGVAMAAGPPTPVTGGASEISDNAATLHGNVNPNGSATTFYFEWGTTTAYKTGTSPVKSVGSGSSPVAVSAPASHLAPNTTYHYALVASNANGTVPGQDQMFTTTPAPSATTGPATQLSTSSATLTGTVNTSGQTTTWYFQWGPGALIYQTKPKTIGPSSSPQSVSYTLPGLRPGTMYHYRLVASHPRSAAVTGAVDSFLTYPPSPSFTRVIAHTRPLHARHRPYKFTTYGVVLHPYWIPPQFACVGEVTIKFFHRHHRVRRTTVALQPDCKYSAVTVFHHLPGHGKWKRPVRLRVIAEFLPNPYLGSSRSKTVHVLVG